MKVLQITTNYPCKENPIFGIFMKEQVDSLTNLGVENTVLFSNGLKSNPKIRFSGALIHFITVIKLIRLLRKQKYDVIHCHSAISGLILKLSGGAKGNNTILSLQNDPDLENTSDGKFIKKLVNIFDKIIIKKPIKLKSNKFVYLPNGVNTTHFQPLDKDNCKRKLGLQRDKRYILFVDSNTFKGRTQKRRDRFDSVIDLLETKYGYNNLEVLTMTKTSREDVPIWMNACDLYLLTSDEEGSPNAVKECMACNIPVVATPVGNIPDLFTDVNDCKVSPDFQPATLASLADSILRGNNVINTRKWIFKKGLDMEAVARKLIGVYNELQD